MGWMKQRSYWATVVTVLVIISLLSSFFVGISTEQQVNRGLTTGEIPEIDKGRDGDYDTATFVTPCFWGTEARLGVVPGVVRTRAGYTASRDGEDQHVAHRELVQVEYDSEKVSYLELLDVFPDGASPTRFDIFAVFSMAEDPHQKYYLRQNETLFQAYKEIYPDHDAFVNSTAAARVNGYMGGYGELDSLDDLSGLGLGERGKRIVYKNWAVQNGISCELP